jgi:hypothetical protein
VLYGANGIAMATGAIMTECAVKLKECCTQLCPFGSLHAKPRSSVALLILYHGIRTHARASLQVLKW